MPRLVVDLWEEPGGPVRSWFSLQEISPEGPKCEMKLIVIRHCSSFSSSISSTAMAMVICCKLFSISVVIFISKVFKKVRVLEIVHDIVGYQVSDLIS